jgi:apolipoprotein N-acyltransferase
LSNPQPEPQQSRIQAWFGKRTPWQRRGVAFLAGALATLGHAPFYLVLFFVAAIVLLIWLLDAAARREKKISAAFWTGWWFALGHFATGLYWIVSAFLVDADTFGIGLGIASLIALAGFLAIFWGVGCAVAVALWTRDVRRIFIFAACVFAVEWLRGNILTGFPWLLPAYVWTAGEQVSQLASLVGAYGLSLITLLAAATPAVIADGGPSAGRRFAPMIAAALVLGLVWGWGAQRLSRAPVDPPDAQPIVRVADSGLSQAEKWRYRPDQESRVLRRYLEASGAAEDARASILVWPEGAIPTLNFFMLDNPAFMTALGQGLGDRALVTGLTRCEPSTACDAYMRGETPATSLTLYNSAAVIDGVIGQPRLSQIYDKHHLVPGGEYIPFWNFFRRFNIAPLQRIGAGFTPGPPPTRLVVPEAPEAVVLICYEAIFPGMVPRGDERPGWIISVTNDAWFGNGSGPYQHLAMAQYRSIEEGLPMARAASGGISAIVDAQGRLVASTRGRALFAEAQLPPALAQTLFSSWGNLLLLALVAAITALRFVPALTTGRGRIP